MRCTSSTFTLRRSIELVRLSRDPRNISCAFRRAAMKPTSAHFRSVLRSMAASLWWNKSRTSAKTPTCLNRPGAHVSKPSASTEWSNLPFIRSNNQMHSKEGRMLEREQRARPLVHTLTAHFGYTQTKQRSCNRGRRTGVPQGPCKLQTARSMISHNPGSAI